MAEKGPQLLFLSNGHGEDLIATRLAQSILACQKDLLIQAMPIVGQGLAYQEAAIPLILAGKDLPSGGFARNSLKNLLSDIQGGLWQNTLHQIKTLKAYRHRIDGAVCVGDCFLLCLAGFFLKVPLVFLPTAKSDHIAPHWPLEISLMRRLAQKIYPRDALTATSLQDQGLPAEFKGNIMMDCLPSQGDLLPQSVTDWVIGLLPGGRQDAYQNMVAIARVVIAFAKIVAAEAPQQKVKYLLALGKGLVFEKLADELISDGWSSFLPDPAETKAGIIGNLVNLKLPSRPLIVITQGRFGDVLAASDAVIGLAGTANEQAVGLGKPVVAFPGRGTQYTLKFAKVQKLLLGEGLQLVTDPEPEQVARKLHQLVTQAKTTNSFVAIGKERMGEPGGADRIAQDILNLVSSFN